MILVYKYDILAAECFFLTNNYRRGYVVCIVTLGYHSINAQNVHKQYITAYNTHSIGITSSPSLGANSRYACHWLLILTRNPSNHHALHP